MAALLEIDRLTVTFGGASPVLDGVSLGIAEGEVLALVGESGSGKSMTALSIMRLLPEGARMDAAAVRLGETDLVAASEGQMNSVRGGQASMLFQQPKRALDPTATVGSQIGEPLRKHLGMSRSAARRRVVELLHDVGVDEPERRARSYPHQLSGGLAQRVMIAAAMAAQPRLLIADEPTTALDVTVEAQILALIAQKKAELGMSVLFISHDLGVVASIADRIAVMYAGRIVEQGPTAEILDAPSHPYTQALILCSSLRPDESGELYVIPDGAGLERVSSGGCRFQSRCHRAVEAHVEHHCASREPELVAAPGGTSGHDTRCWAASTMRESA
ncbi:ABC transporter ATP-binding protein [Actinopolymorpha alba]|uniref:ABC transporter ATP-binding protein n=1 Tax=Actinopolymorpha alba TaxID=533267 RepID=UPI0003777F97|nr:ABC transporter ATP-binding protein [Actinopolymorpha alba]